MIAITRDVSPSIAQCELTHLDRNPIDYERAVAQHQQYRELLSSLGAEVIELPGDAAYPDCVFVEDTALVFDELAVITRPGAESRRGETTAIADALAPYRRIVHIDAPATIDGGDVLIAGERIYVGLSERTNEESLTQLRRLTGREVIGVAVDGCLHLKTAITRVSSDTMLVNRAWIDVRAFDGWEFIDVDPSEPHAANALLFGDAVVYSSQHDLTRRLLEERGIDVRTVDASELAKAEGGVTCCSLLIG